MTWESLEEEGAVIGGVEVVVNDVFDTSRPREDHLVGRSANFIHIRSRRLTIYRELLFKAGDRVDARLMAETERRLRSRSYIGEARVEPLPNEDGTVTARVTVVDTWSLKGGLKFRQVGGDAEWAVDLEEVNLLGLGKTLRLGYEQNRERSIARLGYKDPALFGSRWRFAVGYADLSDGSRKSVSLGRPF
jgi:outer membrane protein assembly factor BamA